MLKIYINKFVCPGARMPIFPDGARLPGKNNLKCHEKLLGVTFETPEAERLRCSDYN